MNLPLLEIGRKLTVTATALPIMSLGRGQQHLFETRRDCPNFMPVTTGKWELSPACGGFGS